MRRDHSVIDAELRLIAALRRNARVRGGPLPANDRINDLLDERLSSVDSPGRPDRSPPSRARTSAPSTLG
ncbi:hypothetical protein CIW49_05615 [Mycolicibacterium sp. P1-18]|uniref:hypothetical protein n=1 Tax=Mycolicibacterium sp. P1-18 TaxID=2024615 RepID=UPI0011F2C8EF|nr:hypothetical protein [Mycolicibacterium sp. P1-18]KAA0101000.1 hypothetical protein CIW49_05615 [Mycolicibacterium sp. P1-18]